MPTPPFSPKVPAAYATLNAQLHRLHSLEFPKTNSFQPVDNLLGVRRPQGSVEYVSYIELHYVGNDTYVAGVRKKKAALNSTTYALIYLGSGRGCIQYLNTVELFTLYGGHVGLLRTTLRTLLPAVKFAVDNLVAATRVQ